jgi:hypothetical protein
MTDEVYVISSPESNVASSIDTVKLSGTVNLRAQTTETSGYALIASGVWRARYWGIAPETADTDILSTMLLSRRIMAHTSECGVEEGG